MHQVLFATISDKYLTISSVIFGCFAGGVAGAAGDCGALGRECSTSEPTSELQTASGRSKAICPEPHALQPENTMVNTSALLLRGIGYD